MATLENILHTVIGGAADTGVEVPRARTEPQVQVNPAEESAASLRPLILHHLTLPEPTREELNKELYLLDCD